MAGPPGTMPAPRVAPGRAAAPRRVQVLVVLAALPYADGREARANDHGVVISAEQRVDANVFHRKSPRFTCGHKHLLHSREFVAICGFSKGALPTSSTKAVDSEDKFGGVDSSARSNSMQDRDVPQGVLLRDANGALVVVRLGGMCLEVIHANESPVYAAI